MSETTDPTQQPDERPDEQPDQQPDQDAEPPGDGIPGPVHPQAPAEGADDDQ